MKNSQIVIFVLLLLAATGLKAQDTKGSENCQSTKEYVTTLNYLKAKKEYGLEDKKSQEIAHYVSSGCNGAAGRFIQTMNFLTDAEVPTNLSLQHAKIISQESDIIYSNFVTIFKKIYVEKFFDLPAGKSLKIAGDLTAKMDKDAKFVMEDFDALGDFCLGQKGLDLGYDKCSDFIFNVLTKTKNISSTIHKAAIESFDFLVKEENGPKISVIKALAEIEKISEFGNSGFSNYKEAYLFGSSEKGLNLKNGEAMTFAADMARKTFKK